MATAIRMLHTSDPADEIRKDIGIRLDDSKVTGALVLVGVYMRPKKTAGGIILTDNTAAEDKFQGKVGLVLGMGPLAFKDDDVHKFGDVRPAVGDWIVFSIGDTFAAELGGRRVRFVEDVDVKMIIPSPDVLW